MRARVASGDGGGVTAYEIVKHFWGDALSTHEVRFALVEVVAHLEYMRLRGEISREDREGVRRYAL